MTIVKQNQKDLGYKEIIDHDQVERYQDPMDTTIINIEHKRYY